MRFLKFVLSSVLTSALCGGAFSRAQTSEAPVRVAGPLDEQARTLLRGNVSPIAQPQYDRGELAGETQMARMRIVLARSADRQAALDQFERELQDKSSPNYHKWIAPDEWLSLSSRNSTGFTFMKTNNMLAGGIKSLYYRSI